MSTPYPQRWYTCALCHESTQHAITGNRPLSRRDVMRLPADHPPMFSWRCAAHRRSKMLEASAVWASELGDLCFTLVCGHQVQWVFRGVWGYAPMQVQQGLATHQIRLEQRQRCDHCGDLERESEGKP
jgi:hypothetical protein